VEKQFNAENFQCRMTHGRVVGCFENYEMFKTIKGIEIRLPTTGLADRVCLRVSNAPVSEGFCVGDCRTWPIKEWDQ
jgi:hypothetical protein